MSDASPSWPVTPDKKAPSLVTPGTPKKGRPLARQSRGTRTTQGSKQPGQNRRKASKSRNAEDEAAYKPSHTGKDVELTRISLGRASKDSGPNYSEPEEDDDDGVEDGSDGVPDSNDRVEDEVAADNEDAGDRTLGPGDRTLRPLGLEEKLTLLDMIRKPLPDCPLVAKNVSTHTNEIRSESLKEDIKVPRSRSNSNASQADDQMSNAGSEITTFNRSNLPELSEVVFIPSMISKLQVPMENLMASVRGNAAVDLSVSKDAEWAAQFMPHLTSRGMPQRICTEMDIQSLSNRIVIVPANTFLNDLIKDGGLSPYIGTIGGARHIPDTAAMEIPDDPTSRPNKLHVAVEYKTPGSLPANTFERPRISIPDWEPLQLMALPFLWPSKRDTTQTQVLQNLDNPRSGNEALEIPKEMALVDSQPKQERDRATKIIMQVYAQLSWHGINHMILSSYEHTYFLIRRGSRLAISRPYASAELTLFDVISFMALSRGEFGEVATELDGIIKNARTDWWDADLKARLRDDPEHKTFRKAGIQECANLEAMAKFLKQDFPRLRRKVGK